MNSYNSGLLNAESNIIKLEKVFLLLFKGNMRYENKNFKISIHYCTTYRQCKSILYKVDTFWVRRKDVIELFIKLH